MVSSRGLIPNFSLASCRLTATRTVFFCGFGSSSSGRSSLFSSGFRIISWIRVFFFQLDQCPMVSWNSKRCHCLNHEDAFANVKTCSYLEDLRILGIGRLVVFFFGGEAFFGCFPAASLLLASSLSSSSESIIFRFLEPACSVGFLLLSCKLGWILGPPAAWPWWWRGDRRWAVGGSDFIKSNSWRWHFRF